MPLVFSRLPLVFFSCPLVLLSPALLLGFLPCLLSCSLSCFLGFVAWLLVLVGLLFLFPLRTASDIKRKGAKCIPCVLACCCGCFIRWLNSCIVIKKFRCRCFGFFQFVRLVCPTNASSIRRLAGSYFDFLRHYVDITYNRPAFLK